VPLKLRGLTLSSLKTKWINKRINYDGTQLHSLFAYLKHNVLGESVVAFRGSCDVSFKHMVDGEDLIAQAKIQGSDMVHFIFELFDKPLIVGVLLQRLFASIVSAEILTLTRKKGIILNRSGDDIYFNKGKMSISIATRSPNSIMVHFAVNISNIGTPVETACLNDLGVDPKKFAKNCLEKIQTEYESIIEATHKVRAVN
jgi:hypothetical protein